MKNLLFLDNLKIRGSYGKMGNDQVGAYQYLTTYSYGSNYVIGKNDVTGLVQNGVPNPNITWEVAKTTNIGFDSRLWNGLLGIEFDYFKTRRSNILTKRSAIYFRIIHHYIRIEKHKSFFNFFLYTINSGTK